MNVYLRNRAVVISDTGTEGQFYHNSRFVPSAIRVRILVFMGASRPLSPFAVLELAPAGIGHAVVNCPAAQHGYNQNLHISGRFSVKDPFFELPHRAMMAILPKYCSDLG